MGLWQNQTSEGLQSKKLTCPHGSVSSGLPALYVIVSTIYLAAKHSMCDQIRKPGGVTITIYHNYLHLWQPRDLWRTDTGEEKVLRESRLQTPSWGRI